MYVYIDESGDSRVFLMAAIKCQTSEEAREGIKMTRRYIRDHNKNVRNPKERWNVSEIKETALHNRYRGKIKEYAVEAIACQRQGKTLVSRLSVVVVAVYFHGKGLGLDKSSMYKELSVQLLKACRLPTDGTQVNVVFDQYSDAIFQVALYERLRIELPDVRLTLKHEDSERLEALQAVDIVAGVLRRHLNGEDLANYEKISPLIAEFREITSF